MILAVVHPSEIGAKLQALGLSNGSSEELSTV